MLSFCWPVATDKYGVQMLHFEHPCSSELIPVQVLPKTLVVKAIPTIIHQWQDPESDQHTPKPLWLDGGIIRTDMRVFPCVHFARDISIAMSCEQSESPYCTSFVFDFLIEYIFGAQRRYYAIDLNWSPTNESIHRHWHCEHDVTWIGWSVYAARCFPRIALLVRVPQEQDTLWDPCPSSSRVGDHDHWQPMLVHGSSWEQAPDWPKTWICELTKTTEGLAMTPGKAEHF